MFGPQPLRPMGSAEPGREFPLLLCAARISVEMTDPIARQAVRLKVEAAQARTGKTVGQCEPMQEIPAPCRISMPQLYGGMPKRETPAGVGRVSHLELRSGEPSP